jgi:hypothetical protein
MKKYQVCVTITYVDYVDVVAESVKDAELQVHEQISSGAINFYNEWSPEIACEAFEVETE